MNTQINNKEQITEDILMNIYSYIQIINPYIQENLSSKEIVHIGLVIDKINEELLKAKDFYKFFDE